MKYKELNLIGVAVINNICKPRKEEANKFTHERWARASPMLEGDSQIGSVLFIGVAKELGYPKQVIASFLNIEEEEYKFKLEKFKDRTAHPSRLKNKADLVRNYVRLHSNK